MKLVIKTGIAALLIAILFWSLPYIAQILVKHPTFNYASSDATKTARYLQNVLLTPFGKYQTNLINNILVFPYFWFLFAGISWFYARFKKIWNRIFLGTFAFLLFLFIFPNIFLWFESDAPSRSTGTVSNGKIENAKRLPFRGDNFTSYSFAGYLAGRTFVHEKVRSTVLDAFDICKETCPETCFIIGETGRKKGGRFMPHRTHQNGLSVDLMTPLLKHQKPYRFAHIFNLWGYGYEFDKQGKMGNIEVDYETMVKWLVALDKAAKKNGMHIQKIIFDPVLRKHLLKAKGGSAIQHLPFTKNRVVIRHDDHFHIDFKPSS